VFDGTLRQGLSVQLEQSPFLSIVSNQQIRQTLQMMGQKPDAKLTPGFAQELCQRTGSKAYVSVRLPAWGANMSRSQCRDCQTGDSLLSSRSGRLVKKQVLAAMDKAAVKLRAKLGESLSTIQKFDRPLEQAPHLHLKRFRPSASGGNIRKGRFRRYYTFVSAGHQARSEFWHGLMPCLVTAIRFSARRVWERRTRRRPTSCGSM